MSAKPTYKELESKIHDLEKNIKEKTMILDHVPDHLIIQDLDQKITWANTAAMASVDKNLDDILNKHCYEIFQQREKPCRGCPIPKVMRTEAVSELETVTPDGRIYRIYGIPIKDEEKRIVGVLEHARDITARKRAEEALRESESRYRTVTETVKEGIILQAASGEIMTWNKGAEEIFGIRSKETIGQTSEGKEWSTIHEDGSPYKGKDHPSMRSLRTGKPFRNEIMGVYRSKGELRWISINTDPLFKGKKAEPYAVAISFSDITDLKKGEEKLKKANAELDQRVKERTLELEQKTNSLQEFNTALNVLLKKRDKDKALTEERILSNVKRLIEPLIGNLKNSALDEKQTVYVDALEIFLRDIISPFTQTLHAEYLNLTPSEIRVANFIKEGKTTKETAVLLDTTPRAIEFHRQKIRKKLGLTNQRANLAAYLLSILK